MSFCYTGVIADTAFNFIHFHDFYLYFPMHHRKLLVCPKVLGKNSFEFQFQTNSGQSSSSAKTKYIKLS